MLLAAIMPRDGSLRARYPVASGWLEKATHAQAAWPPNSVIASTARRAGRGNLGPAAQCAIRDPDCRVAPLLLINYAIGAAFTRVHIEPVRDQDYRPAVIASGATRRAAIWSPDNAFRSVTQIAAPSLALGLAMTARGDHAAFERVSFSNHPEATGYPARNDCRAVALGASRPEIDTRESRANRVVS